MADLDKLYQAVLNGDAVAAAAVTRQAIDEGMDPLALVQGTMVPAMGEVGKRFVADEYFVPELLLSARAMKGSLELLRPLLAGRDAASAGRVAIGTVQGDLHDIGKNLVAAMLEGGGFEVIDLGTDVPPQKFVDAIQQKGAQIVALSALLTVTMASMTKTIEALTAAGVRDRVKVIVGGAPVTQQYADAIGADGYSENASSAVALARRLCGAP
jgi:corrinoid protein of di/trimethylamine methyltransferase